MATLIPVTASWIEALTSAIARKPRRVTRRARLRMLKATSTIATEMPSTASVSCQEIVNNTTARITNDSIWPMMSVISTTTCENSWVSVVMRLMMRPERYWSKKDMSWFMTASKASTRKSDMTMPVIRCSSRRRSQLAPQMNRPMASETATSAINIAGAGFWPRRLTPSATTSG